MNTLTIEDKFFPENQKNNYILKKTLCELLDNIQKNNFAEQDIEIRIQVNNFFNFQSLKNSISELKNQLSIEEKYRINLIP